MTQEQRDQLLLDIKKSTEERFDRLDQRLDKMDGRLDNIETRLDNVETRLDKMDQRFDNVETRLDNMDQRFVSYYKLITKKISKIEFTLSEWEPVLSYVQQLATSHEEKLKLLSKNVIQIKKV